MLLWRLKRFPRSINLKTRAFRAVVFAVIFTIIAGIMFWICVKRTEPIIALLARAEAREYALNAIYNAVESEINSGNLVYRELVTLEYDKNGEIAALITDMVKINTLQARIAKQAATNIVNIKSTEMEIHLGDVFGGVMFAGKGPRLPVRVQSVTDVTASFINEFADSGINQTRHRIILVISADIDIIIPGGSTKTNVTAEITVAETVVVGKVPNIYAQSG